MEIPRKRWNNIINERNDFIKSNKFLRNELNKIRNINTYLRLELNSIKKEVKEKKKKNEFDWKKAIKDAVVEEYKMKRQGLRTSIKDLEELIAYLTKQERELNKELGIKGINKKQGWIIGIINKSNCSDTWEIE